MTMGSFHADENRNSHRARRRAIALALGVVLVVTRATTAAFGAQPKPPPGPPQVSGQDAKLPAGLKAASNRPGAAAGDTENGSGPASTSGAGSTSATPPAAPSGTPSTDPALKPVDLGALRQDQSALADLRAAAEAKGSVRVVVTLATRFTALGALTSSQAKSQRAAVLAQSDAVSSIAVAEGATVNQTYGGNIPAVALTVTPAALDALADSPAVAKSTRTTRPRRPTPPPRR